MPMRRRWLPLQHSSNGTGGAAVGQDGGTVKANQLVNVNCCGRAGPGFGHDQLSGCFSGTLRRLLRMIPKPPTAKQTPIVSKLSAHRSKICFMIAPRLSRSAVALASSNSFMRFFWLSGGSSPLAPLDVYHSVHGMA